MPVDKLWIKKIGFLLVAFIVGIVFQTMGVPAGWLLGALLTGIFYGLFIETYNFKGWPFALALALVGANIGIIMEAELFVHLHQYFLPLLVTLMITLFGGLGFGLLLNKWTGLDRTTAFFCTVPGGASEVIALSAHYGADERVVAAFHTARITMFVLIIPFGVGLFYGQGSPETFSEASTQLQPNQLFFFAVVISIAFLLHRLFTFPGAMLIYSIVVGFLLSQFVFQLGTLPNYIAGVGQVLIGAMVGIRFERSTVKRLSSIGVPSLKILAMYVGMALFVALLFFMMTPLNYVTSLLSTVPAGAPEMSSTAFALKLEPSLVASLHIIRMVSIFLVLPLFLRLILKKS
ncbi:AbrB family transcriptional regulator [Geomicrobium sp. JCM 19039]|uniref:AbrB family transcriptional regulator n=1 Tax=Geomicrobium sp. JCM 19039 TaxID=1460636 RepID=UPI0005A8BF22|nr:AbrB family transcriptional regulator [Geomicrobium sp. JCM 19039]